MFCHVSRLRRNGYELDRFHATAAPALGQLQLSERFDAQTRRTVRLARLLPCGGRDADLLPELFDAVVLFASGGTWTVRGTEREASAAGIASYEQSWLVRELRGAQIARIEAAVAAGGEPTFVSSDD